MPKFGVISCSLRWDKGNFETAKKYWEGITGLVTLDFCVALNCIEKEVSFVMIKKTGTGDQTTYIAPLCQKHGVLERECEIYDYYLASLAHPNNMPDNSAGHFYL